ncbi:hypothetical protein PM082_014923 [Marasmius tenuissimus]|nr:hypothetical protein PM082_014923 [Marasmius tenuissimus]
MKSFPRILLFALLYVSCDAFNVTLPDQSPVNQTFKSQFDASKEDFDKAPATGFIGIVLIVPPTPDITCPKEKAGVAPGFETNLDGFTYVKKPDNESQRSGELFLTPKRMGPHILCAYAVSGKDPSQGGGRGFDFEGLNNILLIYESTQFNVTVESSNGNSSTISPAEATSSTGGRRPDEGKGNRGWNHDRGPDTAAVVGGVVGGVAAVCILIALFFYRRFRYQKKLNQFHKEHQLLHQAPPPSIFASTLTGPSHYPVYAATSPPPVDLQSPGSPTTIRPTSHVPLGFDETMQKSYHFPSVGSSPSSYSVPLPHEPALRAQHGPGVGGSNV